MRALYAIFGGLVLVLSASTARADTITRVAFALEADDAVVRIDAEGVLTSPRMHLDPGAVRLWFPGIAQGHFIERHGDGRALRKVTARPGAADTALIVLELGDARRLLPQDVRVVLDGTHATVRIARATLPPAQSTFVPHSAQHAAGRAPAAAATPEVVPTAPPSTVASTATPLVAPAALTPPAPRPAQQLAQPQGSSPRAPTTGFAGAIPDAKSAGVRTLGLVVMLLLGLALFGRWLKQKRGARPAAAIRVVASHRLGAKHQLVVVRAFDQEILLSVNGGETRRIASRRAGEESEMVPMNEPSANPEPRPEASRRLLALVPAAIPAPDHAPSTRPTSRTTPTEPTSPFGAELARLVRGIAPSAPASRPILSESVSGLVRLREAKAQR